ncbi:PREDICTED: tumor necrosis factor ligand superfamily member 9 [Condylura cristata]|uniref:tumor necrosis factor ligand superfamily member 9 n=1 Tax=Condylura cristata TaxID=143302 RepID=UPI000643C52A|nr:PREDICTED: tumor necrosis factor ligand superfamily member 9 [Condylura cristata]
MPCLAEAAKDPEAQRSPEPCGRACCLLPWVLSASLLLLAGILAAAAAHAWILPSAPASLSQDPAPSPTLPEVSERQPDPCPHHRSTPQGLFAKLVVNSAQLTDGPLRWHSNRGLAGVYLSPGLSYDENTQELVVPEAGLYYVFLNLELRRVVVAREESAPGSTSGSVSLQLQTQGLGGEALALTLNLPPLSSGNSTAAFRSGQLNLAACHRLGVHLKVSGPALSHWQLSQATVLGLVRVITEDPELLSHQST